MACIDERPNEMQKCFHGKYMGKVTDNLDPAGLGRIRAKVRTLLGDNETGWAMPCVPYAGNNVGMYFIPPKDSSIWIEFLDGDLEKPIYVGCFWETGQVPLKNMDPNKKILKTEKVTLEINDGANNETILIKTEKDQKIIIKSNSIELKQGGCSIRLTSDAVSINGNNLQVLK
jgi:uncharacterized protein involved in type VI secretion and phage assembly